MAICQTCSLELDPAWKYCTACGTPTERMLRPPRAKLEPAPADTSSRSRQTGTATRMRQAAEITRSRRGMIAGIIVLLAIAIATIVVLIAVSAR